MVNMLIGVVKSAEVNKEFIVLFSILCVLVSILVMIYKAYVSFKVKQEHCEGRFNLQDLKIDTIGKVAEESKKDSKEALEVVRRVETCTDKMQGTVSDIQDFIEDKYKNAKKEKSNAS